MSVELTVLGLLGLLWFLVYQSKALEAGHASKCSDEPSFCPPNAARRQRLQVPSGFGERAFEVITVVPSVRRELRLCRLCARLEKWA